MSQDRLNLSELKAKSPKDLLSMAEELEIENASTMRKGDMMFAILKEQAEDDWVIGGEGVLEVCKTGSGFCAHRKRIICPARTISMSRRT